MTLEIAALALATGIAAASPATAVESAAAKAFVSQACTACGSSCASAGTAEIFPYLTDADLAQLSGCDPALCALFSGPDGHVRELALPRART